MNRSFALQSLLAAFLLVVSTVSGTAGDTEDAVLAVNAEFYRAFHDRDMPGMDAVWGRQEPISVVHPGWQEIKGRAPVMASWNAIFNGGNSPRIKFTNARVQIDGELAMVTCDEIVDGGVIRAVNFFKREDGAWRMIYHGAATAAGLTPS